MCSSVPRFLRVIALAVATLAAPCALAAAGRGEFVDKMATGLAIFIIIALPIGGIVLFWLVHVLPEKIAEKRHHPQKDAIHVLCLLSLVFGGLLWPLAWLWAYTKPVLHKMAYGRDRHDDYYAETEAEGDATDGEEVGLHEDLARLRQDLDALEQRGELPETMRPIREQIERLVRREAASQAAGGTR
jgi:CBS domain containing-hemolysin-like protein